MKSEQYVHPRIQTLRAAAIVETLGPVSAGSGSFGAPEPDTGLDLRGRP
jgi:hypothetical protein